MKICPKCHNQHKKLGKFCSRSCANSRNFSAEAKKKKSIANIKSWEIHKEKRIHAAISRAKKLREKNQTNSHERTLSKYEKLMDRDWDSLGYDYKRWIVIYQQNNCCNRCKLNSWLNKPLILEIDHTDGDRYNNSRHNLEGLCPNCHSLTDTWRGKHRKKKLNLTDKEIYDIYIREGNIANTFKALSLRPSGNTRKRILKAVQRFIGE